MSKFLFMCLILFTGQHYAVGFLDHAYEYVEEADTWLRLHVLRDQWADARHLCHLEGGLLASPSTSALAQAMLRIMASHKVLAAFTGIHALITEGEYESLDGVPPSEIPLDWDNDKPFSLYLRPDHCVVLNATGKVNDVSCTNNYPYFCRKETTLMNASHVCGTTARGYELEPRTGSCYKFHRAPKTWHRGARVCHAEGGHLVIINSDTESQVVQDIFKKILNDTIVEAENTDSALLTGVWQWNVYNGEWQTVHGETLEEAGYAKWNEESSKDRKNGYAAGIQRTGLLVPISRFDKHSYICEITP